MDLPGASLKEDKAIDKLGYYDRAAADSLKLQEQMKNDPYFTKDPTVADSVLYALTGNIDARSNSATIQRYNDPNEARVYEKLGQLNAAMKDAAGSSKKNSYGGAAAGYGSQTGDVEKLEQIMAAGGNAASGITLTPR